MNDNLLNSMLLEYMLVTLDRYQNEVDRVVHRLSYWDVFSSDYYDLMVCKVRLDCLSSEFSDS